MNKIIIYTTFIILFLTNICYCQREDSDLYALTTHGSDASKLNLIVTPKFGNNLLLEKTIQLPSNLSIQAITYLDSTNDFVTILCASNTPGQTTQTFNLVSVNVTTGQQTITNGITYSSGALNIESGYQNYIISQPNHIYLIDPNNNSNGIKLIDLFFYSSLPSYKTLPSAEFFIENTQDFDTSFGPVGAISIDGGNLIVVYKSTSNPEYVATIIVCNLNGTETGESSSSLSPLEVYNIKLFYEVSLITQIYTDHIGNIYIVQNDTQICQVNLDTNYCDILPYLRGTTTLPNFNYNPFLIPQSKLDIISIEIENNSISFTEAGYNWAWSAGFVIPNYWQNNLPGSYTYFAI
ncbi:hypothetical protein DICPUDRAFT_154092 [Dictyostelium purpureum]|uniref:Uncharacterized protein n=1 Tax=Dictyostelium purpureum TaxID=5786 RepID=F0ZQJ9_DICPU|nr:uncharacterized protein DICPUDRAFT_154092 [Dictyostelium purpureum]EGC33779.1 hypothetical protein DICPUDRAFT_154092 [Dictyostelium purpureum]|eukprot:XP_003289704.1 hypothetical protein DICPUDRAFT_154092 [Dictyostelium purpureum]